jgi:DNA-binding response OmpR family regulator
MSAPRDRVPVVLLVDVSIADRTLYADYLWARGYRVINCFDTSAALHQAVNADVVVTGISVPGPFDGVELVRRIRGNGRRSIVLGAAATEADRVRALQAGCDAFIAKPCTPETLFARIETLQAQRGGPVGHPAMKHESIGADPARADDARPRHSQNKPAARRTKGPASE